MYILFQFLLVGIIFFVVGYISWWFTEKDDGHVPEFLDFKPFSCRMCLTFWSLVAVYIALGIGFKMWVVLIGGIVLAILNAIAMYVNQKQKTIKISDLNNDNKILDK